MAGRYRNKADSSDLGVRFCTFHSLFFSVIRTYSEPAPGLLGEEQKAALLKDLRKDFAGEDSDEEKERVFKEYQSYLKENNLIDYDSMAEVCRRILTERPEIRKTLTKKYRHILIDEFQDINQEQYRTILLFLGEERNLFAVGDDDQAIYGFRGSDPSIIEEMRKDFPDAARIILNVNYRSVERINDAAQLLISENRKRVKKKIRADRRGGRAPKILPFPSEEEQYRYIRSQITGEESGSSAVLFRSNRQMARFRSFIDPVGKSNGEVNNPVDPVGVELVSAVLDYFAASRAFRADPAEALPACIRIMNCPDRHLTRSALLRHSQSAELLFHELTFLQLLSPVRAWDYLLGPVGLRQFLFCADRAQAEILDAVLAGIRSSLRGASDLREAEFLLRSFDVRAALNRCRVTPAPARADGLDCRLSLMTLHSAKGLEFDRVFLPDLNDGIIPGRRAADADSIEEERRLLYVGMTRARNELTLSYVRGSSANPLARSRFLDVFDLPRDIEKDR